MSAPDPGTFEASPPPPQESLGELARLVGVFVSPAETFADIARKPSFIVPLLIVMVLGLVSSQIVVNRVGLENIIRKQIEKSSRAQEASKAQLEAGVEMGMKIGRITQYLNPVFIAAGVAIVAGLLLLMANFVFGGSATYKQLMAATCFAWVPPVLVSSVLTVVIVMLKDPADIDIENLLVTNLGVIVSAETSKFLHRLAVSLDLVSFWQIWLLGSGIAASAKLKTGKAMTAVIIPWVVYVLGASALAGFR
jgi:hypothetical protein